MLAPKPSKHSYETNLEYIEKCVEDIKKWHAIRLEFEKKIEEVPAENKEALQWHVERIQGAYRNLRSNFGSIAGYVEDAKKYITRKQYHWRKFKEIMCG